MRTLVIDTATQALSLALFEGEHRIAATHEIVGRGHAERLVPAIAELPNQGRADRIAVDVGPGSFTGVRIGLAAARALAFAWAAELSGFSTLAMIAATAAKLGEIEPIIAAVVTGGHGELFWQRFDAATLSPLTAPASTPIDVLSATLTENRVFGSGAEALVVARGSGDAVGMHPSAENYMLMPEALRVLAPSPIYGRGADAKPMAERGTV